MQIVARVPDNTVLIDTFNYFSVQDVRIEAIEQGQVESEWVQEQLERRAVKAWSAIGADPYDRKALNKKKFVEQSPAIG